MFDKTCENAQKTMRHIWYYVHEFLKFWKNIIHDTEISNIHIYFVTKAISVGFEQNDNVRKLSC